jgi:hypothetical protein
MEQILAGGQGAGGSGTARQADVIDSSLNSSQGIQQGSGVNVVAEGGSNQCVPMLFPVPSFNVLFSIRFIDASGALFGVVGSFDTDTLFPRPPPPVALQ